jgi:predicted  nucleic acid-binding Zn-ribbon protein
MVAIGSMWPMVRRLLCIQCGTRYDRDENEPTTCPWCGAQDFRALPSQPYFYPASGPR